MDLEAMQLLNLSPIPELSELELSTMLEQLSGLSDINGDLTDRNVEDIIKEAEDLLDKSKSSDLNVPEGRKSPEPKEQELVVFSKDIKVLDDKEGPDIHQTEKNESKLKNPVDTDHLTPQSNSYEPDNANKYSTSPVETIPTKIPSGGSYNHIKSTIDSLKEFSSLVEKKLNHSPTSSVQPNKTIKQDEKINKESSQVNEKSSTKQTLKNKTVKTQEAIKKNATEPSDKSIRILNCFERLYQDRPVRLTTCRKPKVAENIPKPIIKRKLSKEFKNLKKINRPLKTIKRDVLVNTARTLPNTDDFLPSEAILLEDESFSQNKEEKFYSSDNVVPNKLKSTQNEEEAIRHSCLRHSPTSHYHSDCVRSSTSSIDEKLILRVLEEMEEIKDQVKKVGVFTETQNQTGMRKGSPIIFRSPKLEIRPLQGNFEMKKSADIKRLEDQVSMLKEKYDHQIEKLESENLRLREALNNKFFTPQIVYTDVADGSSTERKTYKPVLNFSPPTREELECKAPKNTPNESPENSQTISKEAYSQTELDIKTTSSQCSQEVGTLTESGAGDPKENVEGETKETENKENLINKKKSGKWKPFSDINIHHLMKQKKTFDHETELIATVRGLQAEVSAKEKENRKLRTEVDSLRRQINKWTSLKIDTCRKCHIGTQTIGLGPIVQKPYNPENFEAPQEPQRENEDLELRIRELEEELELLKEKRISDLQALHQVHEEEMAKLVSKLETQSALTKHLHSLLVSR